MTIATSATSSPIPIVLLEPETTANAQQHHTPPVIPPPAIVPPRARPSTRPAAPTTPLAWHAPTKLFAQLPASAPRVSDKGGYRPDFLSGNLPKLNPGPAPDRVEGLADRPDTHARGTNPLALARPARGGHGPSAMAACAAPRSPCCPEHRCPQPRRGDHPAPRAGMPPFSPETAPRRREFTGNGRIGAYCAAWRWITAAGTPWPAGRRRAGCCRHDGHRAAAAR